MPRFSPTITAWALALAAALPVSAVAQGAAGANPFGSFGAAGPAPAAGSVLTAPVTLNANTPVTSDAFTATQTGAGRALSGIINKTSNTVSAVKGLTNGSGSGINGVNIGTTGPAGKFQVTNAGSGQAALVSTTTGTGNAVLGIISNTGTPYFVPAILGQNKAGGAGNGVGIEGDGGYAGVQGYGQFGLVGDGDYYGLHASGGYAGVLGDSSSGIGVDGFSQSSYGVRGQSTSSYAGYFIGPVYATGAVTAASYGYTSDRNLKQSFEPVDNADVLGKIAALPISSWDFKAKPGIRHLGPMAQDFHAAFGLGADDTHIEVVDIAGVSLAAIQALQRQLQAQQARIDALEAKLASPAKP